VLDIFKTDFASAKPIDESNLSCGKQGGYLDKATGAQPSNNGHPRRVRPHAAPESLLQPKPEPS
jgi:hypothetical protein